MPRQQVTDEQAAPADEHRGLLFGLAGLLIGVTVVGVIFAPSLLAYDPLVLGALSPLNRHLLLIAHTTPLVPFVAVITARRIVDATVVHAVGMAYGERSISWFEARMGWVGTMIRAIERLYERAPHIVLFLLPGHPSCILAGTAQMRRKVFIPIVAAGQLMWVTFFYLVGDAMRPLVLPVFEFFSEHALATTLVFVLAAVWVLLRRRTATRGR